MIRTLFKNISNNLLDFKSKNNYKLFSNDNNLENLTIREIDNFTIEIKNLNKLHTLEFEECNNIKVILGKGLNNLFLLDIESKSVEIIDQDNNLDKLDNYSLTVNNVESFLTNKDSNKITDLFINYNEEDITSENIKNISIHGLNLLTISFVNVKNMEIIFYDLPKLFSISIKNAINSKLILNEGLIKLDSLNLANDNTIPTVINNHDYIKKLECYSLSLKEFNDIDNDKYKCFTEISIINNKFT